MADEIYYVIGVLDLDKVEVVSYVADGVTTTDDSNATRYDKLNEVKIICDKLNVTKADSNITYIPVVRVSKRSN